MTARERWPALRRAWVIETGIDERDIGEGLFDAGDGWTLWAIGSNSEPGLLRSHFAVHDTTGFVYEERIVGETRSTHVTSPGKPDPAMVTEAQAKLHGDSRGRHGKMPVPWEYMTEYRNMRDRSGRSPTPGDMARRYGVNPETDRRYRRRFHVPWPPDLYLPPETPTE